MRAIGRHRATLWPFLGLILVEDLLLAVHSPLAAALPVAILAIALIGHHPDTALVLACIGLVTISWDRVSVRIGGLTLKPAYIAFALALAIDLLERTGTGRRTLSSRAAFLRGTVGAVLLLLVLATARGGFPVDGARQLVAIVFGALVPAWACFRLGRSPERREALISWALLGAGFAAAVGAYQFAATYLQLPVFLAYTARAGALGRTAGFSYEPAFFAMYLLSLLPLTVVVLLRPEDTPGTARRFAHIVFCLLLVGVLVANARAGYLLLPVALTLPLIGRSWKRRVVVRPLTLGAASIILVLVGSLLVHFDLPGYARDRLGSITDTKEVASNAPRLRLYATDRRIATDHLALGIGPGALGYRLPEYGLTLAEYFQGLAVTDRSRVVANNIWLQAALDCGIGGVLGVLAVLGVLLRLGLRCKDPYGRWLAAGCLLVFVVGGALTSLFWNAGYWAMMGLALAADLSTSGARPEGALVASA